MFFSMGVALYTSRIVLKVLGVENYGIYNAIGGVVALFSFFNAAMATATQRYFSFELGHNLNNLKKIFNAALNIHIGIAIFFFFLAETIGLWFINNKLNIPTDQTNTIKWVFHFSVLSFIVGILRVPFNALIIAHEKMITYAYLSIMEVILKLLIVYFLIIVPYNKLILYSFLIFFVTSIIGSIYIIYCYKNFKESKYKFIYDKNLYKELISYSGWNLFGNIAAISKSQGINILLNIFFGPILNAAYAISLQVQSAIRVFITNFQLAVNPQIIKNYASGEIKNMFFLINQSSKLSFILIYILSLPLLFDTEYILNLWLDTPPNYTTIFVLLITINLLIDSLSGPLMTGIQATGKIKYYQIIVGALLFLNLPISYFLIKHGEKPEIIFIVSIIISIFALIARLFFIKKLIKFPIVLYLKKVIARLIPIILLSLIIPYLICHYFSASFIRLIILLITSGLTILILLYFIGFEKKEREYLKKVIVKKLK